jgi:hypothetical protein
MIPRCASLVAVLVVPLLVCAEEKPPHPTAPPPQVCVASAAEKDGVVQIRVTVPRMVPVTVAKVVPNADGKQITGTETIYKAEMVETVLTADGEEVQVSRKDGKAVDPKDLPKLLAKETRVLVFSLGKVDPYYLDVVNDQVLIITVPASKTFPRPRRP